MSKQDITGKKVASSFVSGSLAGKGRVLYRLSDAWAAHCQALTVQVSDVQALAGQGAVVEAYRLLRERLAGTGTGATGVACPQGAPFAAVAPAATFGQAAGLPPAMQAGAAGAPAQSAASAVPTAGFAGAAGTLGQRGQSVSASKKFRRFRPLVRSRVLMARSFHVPRISMQVFVWKAVAGGASNG